MPTETMLDGHATLTHLTNHMNMKSLIEKIDALLPQTQCGECSYGGCLPYAKAMAEQNETINRCPPGGVKTLIALAELLNRDASVYIEEMMQKERLPQVAFIRPDECIGCTKCIQACPVDAIIGGAKQLHIVLTNECTGCGLCVTPCPVDCIDMLSLEKIQYQPAIARQRFQHRQTRLETEKQQENSSIPQLSAAELARKAYIESAVKRAKAKKEQQI